MLMQAPGIVLVCPVSRKGNELKLTDCKRVTSWAHVAVPTRQMIFPPKSELLGGGW